MKRFFRWLKALFNRGMDKLEDPELMLDQARRDMQGALIQNREKAVQAITQKNRLQGLLDENERKSAMLATQAETALRTGNRELAKNFLREKSTVDSTLEQFRTALAQAVESVEAVKVAVKRQEEEVKRRTAEALALKAQWKQSQIQSSITKALEGLSFENEYEGSFSAARDRIKDMQAEASARQEMFSGSIQGKMMAMDDQAADYAAEDELRKLEERLGMAQPNATTGPVATETTSDVDSQLTELEKRIGQGQ